MLNLPPIGGAESWTSAGTLAEIIDEEPTLETMI